MLRWQILGFEQIESPKFDQFEVIWLRSSLPPYFSLHLIQRNPSTNLPEGPFSAASPIKDPSHLPRGHHVSFSVSNFDEFVQFLKVIHHILVLLRSINLWFLKLMLIFNVNKFTIDAFVLFLYSSFSRLQNLPSSVFAILFKC